MFTDLPVGAGDEADLGVAVAFLDKGGEGFFLDPQLHGCLAVGAKHAFVNRDGDDFCIGDDGAGAVFGTVIALGVGVAR